MWNVAETAKSITEARTDSLVAKARHLKDYVTAVLVIVQVFVYTGHIDGHIKHWTFAMATPAIILLIFEVIKSLLAFFAYFSVSSEKQEQRLTAITADAAARDASVKLTAFEYILTVSRADLDSNFNSMMPAVSNFIGFSKTGGIIISAILLLLFSVGTLTYENGFSYSLVLGIALAGYMFQLLLQLIMGVKNLMHIAKKFN